MLQLFNICELDIIEYIYEWKLQHDYFCPTLPFRILITHLFKNPYVIY